VVLLRKVRQVEVAGEGPGDVLGPLQVPRGDELLTRRGRPVGGGGIVVVGGDRELAELFDVGEQGWSAVLFQDSAQQLAEQPDVGPQRCRDLEPRMHTRG
jgi:hypothetical protein